MKVLTFGINVIGVFFIIIMIIGGLFGHTADRSPSGANKIERYSSTWSDRAIKEVTIPLTRKGVMGCGCYNYRQDKTGFSEFLVRCGCEPSEYAYYVVWPQINKVMGPYPKETDVP